MARKEVICVVIPCHSTIHAPILARHGRTKIDLDVQISQIIDIGLLIVVEEHINEVDSISFVRERNVCAIRTIAFSDTFPLCNITVLSWASPLVAFVSRSVAVSISLLVNNLLVNN